MIYYVGTLPCAACLRRFADVERNTSLLISQYSYIRSQFKMKLGIVTGEPD